MNDKPSLGARLKSWLIAKATASLLPRIIHSAVLSALSVTFEKAWPWIAGHGLDTVISAQTVSDFVSQFVTAAILLTASAAIGKPVKELQAQAKGIGIYDGEIDGDAGTKTMAAIAIAINRPSVHVIDGQIVDLRHNAP